MRSLKQARPELDVESLERTRRLMDAHTRDCLVSDYEDLIPSLHLPDPNDRHVLAAAIRTRAHVIVTFNLKDFPGDYLSKYGIEAQHPDEFVFHLLDLSPGDVCAAVKRQRAALTKPRFSVAEFLDILERMQLPTTVSRLRDYSGLL